MQRSLLECLLSHLITAAVNQRAVQLHTVVRGRRHGGRRVLARRVQRAQEMQRSHRAVRLQAVARAD